MDGSQLNATAYNEISNNNSSVEPLQLVAG